MRWFWLVFIGELSNVASTGRFLPERRSLMRKRLMSIGQKEKKEQETTWGYWAIGKDKSEELRHPLPEKNLCLKNHVNTDGLRQRFTTVIPLTNKRENK